VEVSVKTQNGPACIFGAVLFVASFGGQAGAYTGQELARNAKVSITSARTIALKAHPGKIVDEELERESGGGGLRYSFDIKTSEGVQELGVDANSGEVLENAREGQYPD
jgi:uncharacterized membrane protein YkoI